MPSPLDRRQFLRHGAVATAGLAVAAAGGVSALSGWSKTSSTSFGTLNYQLSWVKDVEFAGQYLADTKGYYKANGFSAVNLISGGPAVAQDAVVAAGRALVAISSPDATAPAITKGADTVIIGALFQKNPFAMMSLASNPIANPRAMIGKNIGVQSENTPVFLSFLKANNLSANQMTIVPVQFDPTPLTVGQVDGWFSFITNEPLELKVKGFKTVTWLLNDYNYPLVSQVYVVQRSSLQSRRDELKALLKAEIMGWHDSLRDPTAGPKLTVDDYGKTLGLTISEQTLQSRAQNKLILTKRTKSAGIMTITPEMIQQNIHTLALGGTTITGAQLFDTSVLAEVYSENPELKRSPV